MEKISIVKAQITRLNNRCDLENKSIFDVLQDDTYYFFTKIGMNLDLLDEVSKGVLEALIRTKDTRITFNPSMESLDSDEIGIYSKSMGIDMGILSDEIKVSDSSEKNDDGFYYADMEYMSLKEKSIIHFSSNMVIEKDSPNLTINRNTLIKKVVMNIYILLNGQTYQKKVTIFDGLTVRDLEEIQKSIYRRGVSHAFSLINASPVTFKIIDDNITMNNFNNR